MRSVISAVGGAPLVPPPFDQTAGPQSLQHLAGGSSRNAEHVGDSHCEGRRAARLRPVLADRKREEVDGLQVVVDRVSSHLRDNPKPSPPAKAKEGWRRPSGVAGSP